MDSRAVTSYLRGVAIICVMAVHYSGLYAQAYVPFTINIFSSQVVYVFFVLSGYGIYLSLEKSFSGGKSFWKKTSSFYVKRAVRIYPIFWLALLTTPVLVPGLESWTADPWALNLHNVGIYLGVPWLRADSHFWFISAIIQCYLLAPFLYLFLKRIKPWTFLIFTLFVADLFVMITIVHKQYDLKIPFISSMEPFTYFGNLFLENVLLFSMGLIMPFIISKYRHKLKKTAAIGLPLSAMAVLASFFLTIRTNVLFNHGQVYYAVLAIIGIPIFCSYMIAMEPRRILPFKRAICFFGLFSFSLYLLHPHFYGILDLLGLTTINDITPDSMLWTLLLVPLFLTVCVLIEKALESMIRSLSSIYQTGRKRIISVSGTIDHVLDDEKVGL